MLKELKAFLMRGNIVDLAVAVIIGGAFGAIVTSLVKDIITPLIGMAIGQPDFSGIMIGSIAIGKFINAIVNFLIIGTSLFLMIKGLEKAQATVKKEETIVEDVLGPTEVELLADIKALLEKQQG
ncbi:large conductance mechanosensitive channel protein MscL [Streptococcus ovuberis]|uniref:Large-conductance mechanosensitive channel n=1 Tax=Streptococcus ovuberis TaxID=1936207 RepID=A0A7X6N0H6_9STRE|nr:large conductance mechanosensitive channel protein MscL [Streptococcus ovuberis]NKZ21261.1 large conductance mechanosensitive channel protein MscL [Streptococcus ovuberis]